MLRQSHGTAVTPPREFSPIRTGGALLDVTQALVAEHKVKVTIKTNGRYITSQPGSSSSFTFYGRCSKEDERRLTDEYIRAIILEAQKAINDLRIDYASHRTLLEADRLKDLLESIRSSGGR